MRMLTDVEAEAERWATILKAREAWETATAEPRRAFQAAATEADNLGDPVARETARSRARHAWIHATGEADRAWNASVAEAWRMYDAAMDTRH